ncbi:alpha/beta hydrolase [Gordonia sp. TBRC 11910]|uniref:Alpha/beta hydrolase n=1 Tax=Gordonia asplenii TaxID=2725283 RepID=A0A848L180_9ACTN|nr:alpha/beta hydrolase [Gordonia asplenii]NMO04459.1 alpha/beta hydrolase [Gordonia asplenii]
MTATQLSRPPFDPELGAVLSVLAEQIPTLTTETLPVLREIGGPADLTDDLLAEHGLVAIEATIAGYQGADMAVTVVKRADHVGTGPGIYHIHGGGMVIGHRKMGPVGLIPWIVEQDAVLVTAEYRLAPEFPDPYPVEDCYAGLVWMAENAADLGVDATRLIIAGASAGGGLSAGTALLARDRRGPALIGQVLMCPMLDDRDQTLSTHQYPDVGIWTRPSNQYGWGALLGDRYGTDDVSIYAAPARATDLSGLPPTYIDCGSAEVFRDEDIAYAALLWQSGVQAELHVWTGGFHGFDSLAPHTALAQAATRTRDEWVARLLNS